MKKRSFGMILCLVFVGLFISINVSTKCATAYEPARPGDGFPMWGYNMLEIRVPAATPVVLVSLTPALTPVEAPVATNSLTIVMTPAATPFLPTSPIWYECTMTKADLVHEISKSTELSIK